MVLKLNFKYLTYAANAECMHKSALTGLDSGPFQTFFFLVKVTFSSMPSAGASHDFPENQVRGAAKRFHWSEDF